MTVDINAINRQVKEMQANAYAKAPGGVPRNPYSIEIEQLPFDAPTRQPTFDTKGNLLPQYKLDVTKERPETAWAKQAKAIENQNLNLYRDQAMSDSLANQEFQRNRLAETGGLTAGASERIGASGMNALSNQYAGLQNQSSQNLYGIGMQDYANQIGADKFNIANTFQNINDQGQFDWNIFNTGAQAYGAEQMANAYESAADKARQKNELDKVSDILNPTAWAGGKGDKLKYLDPVHYISGGEYNSMKHPGNVFNVNKWG